MIPMQSFAVNKEMSYLFFAIRYKKEKESESASEEYVLALYYFYPSLNPAYYLMQTAEDSHCVSTLQSFQHFPQYLPFLRKHKIH